MTEASTATRSDADLAGGIGRRLAAHRARRGVRVAELAREVGVTPSLISQIERGQSRPSVSTLFALAQALDVPVDAFFREPGPGGATGGPAGGGPGGGAPAEGDPGSRGPADGQEGGASAGGRPAEPEPAAPEPAEPEPAEPEPAEPEPAEPEPAEPEPAEPEPAGPGAGGQTGPLHDDGPRAGESAHAAEEGRYVVRRERRAAIDIDGGVRWERLTRANLNHLDFFELIYEPGAQSHPLPYTHPGSEMVLVTRGRLEITVGFETLLLEAGDSMDFPSTMPHRYVNPGEETARAVTVIVYDCPGGPGPGRRAGHAP